MIPKISFSELLLVDAHRLARQSDPELMLRARERYQRRLEAPYTIDYPEHLTITDAVEMLKKAWQEHQIIILQSETGSGKSTQLPKVALELGFAKQGFIGVTQPRRLATRALSSRLSQELFVRPGEVVGWQVRHHDHTHPDHLLKVMTDGILLQEIHHDKLLRRYTCIILDEAHERSLNIDLILGYLKRILPQRPDLKIAIVSATLTLDAFKNLFPQAYCLDIPGRSFSIEDYYLEDASLSKIQRICWAVDLALVCSGDILMFCATEAEIFWHTEQIQKRYPQLEVLQLYARLPQVKQQKIFTASVKKRLILSTNIAETSLTLPNIGVVIDGGEHKIAYYNPSLKVMGYPIVPIPQSSIKQRRGRCGRTFSGHCFHLYTQEDASSRALYDPPQIQRSSLTQVVLKILSLGVPIDDFYFITEPEPAALKEALQVLLLLGLIDKKQQLTSQGKSVASYPLDPRFCLMIQKAIALRCAYPVVIIVAFLTSDDPRLRPLEQRAQADKKHAAYLDRRSDFMCILSLWERITTEQTQLSRRQFQDYCHDNFLNQVHIRSWQEQTKQLMESFHIRQEDINLQSLEQSFLQIHRALLAGLFDRIFMCQKDKSYLGPRMVKARIHPGAACVNDKPLWLMAMNVEQTHEIFLRWVAPVELHILATYAAHAIVYKNSEPYYDHALEEVFVLTKGLLWGLPIIEGRRSLLRLTDPVLARQEFIIGWFNLEDAELFTPLEQWNEAYKQAFILAERSRQPSALKTHDELAQLAQEFWPTEIMSGLTLRQYHRLIPVVRPDFFLRYPIDIFLNDVPDTLLLDGMVIAINYSCDQTQADDGMSFVLPKQLWQRYHPIAWLMLIPLYRRLIIQHFLEQIPKKQRQELGPLSEVQDFILSEYIWPAPLPFFISQLLRHYYDCIFDPQLWSLNAIPHYMRPCIIMDDGVEWHDYGRLQASMVTVVSDKPAEKIHDWIAEIIIASNSGLMKAPLSPEYDKLYIYDDYFLWNAHCLRAYADYALEHVQHAELRHHFNQLKIKKSLRAALYRRLAAKQAFFILSAKAIRSCEAFKKCLVQTQQNFTDYQTWMTLLETTIEPHWKQSFYFTFEEFKQAHNALISEDFLIQLPSNLLKRVPLWWQCCAELAIKEKTKSQLCLRFLNEWQQFVKLSTYTLSFKPQSLVWSLFFEWAIASLMQPLRSIIPLSCKKALELSACSEGFKKSWL